MLWRNLRACRPAGFLRFILFLPASPASSSNSSASIRVPSLDCRTPKRPVDFQPWRELLSILYSAKNQLTRSAPKHSGRSIRQAWLALLRSIFGIRIAITPSANTAVQCGTSTSAVAQPHKTAGISLDHLLPMLPLKSPRPRSRLSGRPASRRCTDRPNRSRRWPRPRPLPFFPSTILPLRQRLPATRNQQPLFFDRHRDLRATGHANRCQRVQGFFRVLQIDRDGLEQFVLRRSPVRALVASHRTARHKPLEGPVRNSVIGRQQAVRQITQ